MKPAQRMATCPGHYEPRPALSNKYLVVAGLSISSYMTLGYIYLESRYCNMIATAIMYYTSHFYLDWYNLGSWIAPSPVSPLSDLFHPCQSPLWLTKPNSFHSTPSWHLHTGCPLTCGIIWAYLAPSLNYLKTAGHAPFHKLLYQPPGCQGALCGIFPSKLYGRRL